MYKKLSTLVVSTELFHVEPLQHYIGHIARHYKVDDNKLFHLGILIEEVFTHIVSEAFEDRPDGEISISIFLTHTDFVLQFHYMGIPFGYSFERAKNDRDEISISLIRKLSSSYRMIQHGKDGQTVEISISLPVAFADDIPSNVFINSNRKKDCELATDSVTIREIHDDEMELLIQCLYHVFGYTYSSSIIYHPDAILERKRAGLYRGFVAVNEENRIIAHVAMLKDSANSAICECGQAFVSPAYAKRGLFCELKKVLIHKAEELGLKGVCSKSVTGHTYTQRANLTLGCVETGFELGYIPAQLKSNVPRPGDSERQAVISYFYPTSYQSEQLIYIPENHSAIIKETYKRLGLKREFVIPDSGIEFTEKESDVEMTVKTDWNQVSLVIKKPGTDLKKRINNIIRQAVVGGAAVFFVSLSLTDSCTPRIINILERLGFFYSGILPYGLNGSDSLMMQFVVDGKVTPDYVIAVSEWGQKIKEYIFSCKEYIDSE